MDKVVLDSFNPDETCFSPHHLIFEPDLCTVEVTFHTRENPEEPQPTIVFQREKSSFIFSPAVTSIIPKLNELGIHDTDDDLKAVIHLAVSLKNLFRKVSESDPHKGRGLSPFLSKAADFLTSGNLEKPDSVQRRALSILLKEIISLEEEPRERLKSVLEESLIGSDLPSVVSPKLRWLVDQTVLFEALQKKFSGIEEKSLRSSLFSWSGALIDHINTGEGDWNTLRKQLNELTALLNKSPSCPPELKALPAYLYIELGSPYERSPIFTSNLEAQTRLRIVMKALKETVEETKAEEKPLKSLKTAPETKPPSSASKALLPITEGATILSGGGLIVGGSFVDDKTGHWALITAGGALTGAGVGALACHFFLKTKKKIISDGICAAVGALIGVGASLGALKLLDKDDRPLNNADGRNPVRGYGP